MKFVLFIGHHKTGSTALQVYLAENFLKLAREGILYPAVESQGMAQNLASAIAGKDLFVDRHRRESRFNIRVPHNALAMRMLNEAFGAGVPPWHDDVPASEQMLQTIFRQAEAIAPDTLILASEVMSRFADRGWRKTLPIMSSTFGAFDTTILLNLRRPDLHIASWHLQRLKFLQPVKPLREGGHRDYLDTAHFRYDRIVRRWQDAFPQAQLRVRNYTDVIKAGGSVQDFFAQSGINHDPAPQARPANSSIPYALAEIAARAKALPPVVSRGVVTYLLDAADRIAFPGNEKVELFGAENRKALCNGFAAVNTALCDQLGLTEFFPDLEEARRCNEIMDIEAARIALTPLQQDAKEHLPKGAVQTFILELAL